jgi:hypothetical protein
MSIIAQLVETMRALAGAHPGLRPAHAKGLVCARSAAYSISYERRRRGQ